MSQLRLAALVTLLAAGCYSDAAPQSTLPAPQYVAGPPGGAIDPGYGYAYATDGSGANLGPGIAATDPADPADDDDRDDDTDPAANGGFDPARDPSVGAPGAGGAAPGAPAPSPDDVAQLDGAARFGTTANPVDPTASVTDEEIDATLDGYGEWVQTDDYGQVWRPDATVVGVDFTPYESGGSWTYTDAGWAFACDYPWGWLPFHYGRWGWFDGFWGWAPDYYWGPAWVEWRHGGGVVGWRPLPPHRDHHGHGHRWHDRDAPVRDHRHARQYDAHWRFAAVSDFSRPHVRSHLFGNAAEGLRMTSAVAAPPIRGRAPVRAADLMKNRFAAAGRFGPGQARDLRGVQSAGARPLRTYGPTQPPLRTYQPPAPGDRQLHVYPPQGSTYQPPVRTYQPGQTYQPPVRTYQPGQTYQPPVRTYPPGQTYQPPVRTYQPYPPPRSYPQGQRPPLYRPQGQPPPYSPPRTYRPQAPSSPPARTWSPPSNSSPSRSWSAPSHSSSPSPSRSWSAPSHSSGSSSSSSSSGSHSSSSSSHSSSSGHHR